MSDLPAQQRLQQLMSAHVPDPGGNVSTDHCDNRKLIDQKAIDRMLRGYLRGRVCILGVGNRDRGDDAAGSLVAERISGIRGAVVVDAGAVPENYLEKVLRSKPDSVLIIDAADFCGAPGDMCILEPAELKAVSALSTHALSLPMLVEFLTARAPIRVALLAIQPGTIRLGAAMSEEVRGAADLLARALRKWGQGIYA
jgi:hydrogenase maturation protease HycI